MRFLKALGFAAAVTMPFFGSAAYASDAICANPQSAAETALCADPYLMGMHLEAMMVLQRPLQNPGDPLPDWKQMDLANYWIGMEDCEGSFRCLESVISEYRDQVNQEYLDNEETPLGYYHYEAPEGYLVYQSADSPGSDMMRWDDPANFGWSAYLCQLRCSNTNGCAAVGYDPMQSVNGIFGYCSMKSAVTFPLKGWTNQGRLIVRESTLR